MGDSIDSINALMHAVIHTGLRGHGSLTSDPKEKRKKLLLFTEIGVSRKSSLPFFKHSQ